MSSRSVACLDACIDSLPRDALMRLAASGCRESEAVRHLAESLFGVHMSDATTHSVHEVLLSTDLLPYVLSLLGPSDFAVNTVCKLWATVWKATDINRRSLTLVETTLPAMIGCSQEQLVSLPPTETITCIASVDRDGEHQALLVLRVGNQITTYGENDLTNKIDSFKVQSNYGEVAANRHSIWVINEYTERSWINRFDHKGNLLAETSNVCWEEDDGYFYPRAAFMSLKKSSFLNRDVPSLMLFFVTYDDAEVLDMLADQVGPDQMTILDAATLGFFHNFGREVVVSPHDSVWVGDELFVCDNSPDNHRLTVFAEDGRFLRHILFPGRRPKYIKNVKDRLYVVECTDSSTNNHHGPREEACGKRIFVLSLTGEKLQVLDVDIPAALSPIANQIPDVNTSSNMYTYITLFCSFAGKLLVPLRGKRTAAGYEKEGHWGTDQAMKLLTLIGI